MPGRVLGGVSRSPDGTSRSPTSRRLSGTSGVEYRHFGKPELSRGVATAEAASSFDRDERERSIWAHRAGVGRQPPRRRDILRHPATDVPSPNVRSGQRGGRGGDRSGEVGVIRNASGKHTTATTLSSEKQREEGSTEQERNEDPVSQAFKRYSLHRDLADASLTDSRAPEKTANLSSARASSVPHATVPPPTQYITRSASNNVERVRDNDPSRRRRRRQHQPHEHSILTDGYQWDTDGYTSDSGEDEGRISIRRRQRQRPLQRDGGGAIPRRTGGFTERGEGSGSGATSGDEGGGRGRALLGGSTAKSLGWKRDTRNWDEGKTHDDRWRRRQEDFRYEGEPEGDGKSGIREKDDDAEEGEDGGGGDVGPEGERALRRAFDMYDINGDGFITFLEVCSPPCGNMTIGGR